MPMRPPINPGVSPDAPDSLDQLRPGKARRPMPPKRPMMPARPPRGPVNPGVTPDAPDSMAQIGMKKGGSVGSASKRADGIAQRGKTRGKVL